jgi:hypothetical protein
MSSNLAFRRPAHFPQTLGEFRRLFTDDDACAAFLEHVKWPAGFVCQHCGQRSDPMRLSQRPELLHCSRCGGNVLTTAGSVMTGRVIPLSVWFLAAYLLANSLRDVGSQQLCQPLQGDHHEVLYQALALLRRRLRDTNCLPLGSTRSCGHVEVSATAVQYDAAGGCDRIFVAAAVEVMRDKSGDSSSPWSARCAGQLRLSTVPDLSAESVCSFLGANVDPNAVAFTNAGGSHKGDGGSGIGNSTVGAEFGANLEVVRLVLDSLECWCGDYADTAGLPSIRERLDEFAFRFNCGFDTFAIFRSLLGIECNSQVPLYREIALNEWKRSVVGASV